MAAAPRQSASAEVAPGQLPAPVTWGGGAAQLATGYPFAQVEDVLQLQPVADAQHERRLESTAHAVTYRSSEYVVVRLKLHRQFEEDADCVHRHSASGAGLHSHA